MGKRTNTATWLEKYNRWQINVQKDGERRSFTSSTPGRTGQREANKKADSWLDDELLDGNTRVHELYTQWMARLKDNTSKSHYSVYEGFWKNWISETVDRMKISKFTESTAQDIIDNAFKNGKLSKKTLIDIRACLSSFLKYCRKKQVTKLVLEDIEIPAAATVGERTILQPSDLTTLFKSDTTLYFNKPTFEPLIYAFRFEVLTGLRPGEVFGLKWEDINDGVVSIFRSINGYNEETKGKNDNARRAFALPPMAKSALIQQRIYQSNNNITSEYVFTDEHGNTLTQQFYYKRWKRYRDYNKMSGASPYELRHTFVSMVKQLPEGYVKTLVGHSVNMDTFGVYGHEVTGDMNNIANLVQDVFKKNIK